MSKVLKDARLVTAGLFLYEQDGERRLRITNAETGETVIDVGLPPEAPTLKLAVAPQCGDEA